MMPFERGAFSVACMACVLPRLDDRAPWAGQRARHARTPLADSELEAVTGGVIPGLSNMIADKLGDALGQAIDQK